MWPWGSGWAFQEAFKAFQMFKGWQTASLKAHSAIDVALECLLPAGLGVPRGWLSVLSVLSVLGV